MELLANALKFLRIIDDHDGLLSLTNCAVIVVLLKIAIAKQASFTELGSLFCVLANYSVKKIVNKDAAADGVTPAQARQND